MLFRMHEAVRVLLAGVLLRPRRLRAKSGQNLTGQMSSCIDQHILMEYQTAG